MKYNWIQIVQKSQTWIKFDHFHSHFYIIFRVFFSFFRRYCEGLVKQLKKKWKRLWPIKNYTFHQPNKTQKQQKLVSCCQESEPTNDNIKDCGEHLVHCVGVIIYQNILTTCQKQWNCSVRHNLSYGMDLKTERIFKTMTFHHLMASKCAFVEPRDTMLSIIMWHNSPSIRFSTAIKITYFLPYNSDDCVFSRFIFLLLLRHLFESNYH